MTIYDEIRAERAPAERSTWEDLDASCHNMSLDLMRKRRWRDDLITLAALCVAAVEALDREAKP